MVKIVNNKKNGQWIVTLPKVFAESAGVLPSEEADWSPRADGMGFMLKFKRKLWGD
jgi:hypothetical protein